MSDIYEIENDGSNYSSDGCIVELVVCKGKISKLEKEFEKLQEQNKIMRDALESISKNDCCKPCQEAKLVAKSALEEVKE